MSFLSMDTVKRAFAWLRALAPLMKTFSTGGQKETWENIDTAVNAVTEGDRDEKK